jgi:hypothetical protein
MSETCDDCVKGTVSYQTWLVRALVVVIIIGGGLNSWAVMASSEKDAEQDERLAKAETTQAHLVTQTNEINKKLDKLIDITTELRVRQGN